MSSETDDILEARAARLALPTRSAGHARGAQHLVAAVDQTRFALEARWIFGIVAVRHVSQMPGVSPAAAGLIAFRGAPVMAFHATAVLGLARQDLAERTRALVLGRSQPEFSLLVDVADELRDIELSALAPLPRGLVPQHQGLLAGVTPDGTVVLSSAALFESERLHVRTYLRRQR